MTIRRHPDVATLISCAAGSQPEAMAAVVASHISMCPRCAAELGTMQEIGVAMFDALTPAPVTRDPPVVALRAAEAEVGAGTAASLPGDVPAHLAPLIGSSLDQVSWKPIAPGVWHCPIPLSKNAKGDLRLVKVAPGKKLPDHGHNGEELTLLLRGSYQDEFGTFRTGDVADLDDEAEHRPIADSTEGCICLIASEKKARFKGWIARIMQPFLGI
jgi:putative transcriptional regulator